MYLKERNPLSGVFLVDIEKDPTETINLAGKYPKLAKELLLEAENMIKYAPLQETTSVIFSNVHKSDI